MKAISFNFQRAGFLTVLGAAGLLTATAALLPVLHRGRHSRAAELVARCEEWGGDGVSGQQGPGDPKAGKDKKPASPTVQRIAQRNVFSPPPAMAPPQLQAKLIGVLGDEALFDGSPPVKAGGTIGQWRLTKIGPDWVELAQGGKTVTLQVFGDQGGPPPGRPPASPGGRAVGGMSMPAPRPAGAANIELTPEMIERFKSMPPDIRQKALEQLPPEMREKLLSSP